MTLPMPDMPRAAIRGLAEYIASYFSWDAYTWRSEYVRLPADEPITVRFSFAAEPPPVGAALLEELEAILQSPWRTRDHRDGEALVWAPSAYLAHAVVVFAVMDQHGQPGFGYEVVFRDSDAVFPGWFAVRDDHVDSSAS